VKFDKKRTFKKEINNQQIELTPVDKTIQKDKNETTYKNEISTVSDIPSNFEVDGVLEDLDEVVETNKNNIESVSSSEKKKPEKKKPNKEKIAFAFSVTSISLLATSIVFLFIVMILNWFDTLPIWLSVSLIPSQIIGIIFAVVALVLGGISYSKMKSKKSLKTIIIGVIALSITIIFLINLILLI